MKQEFFTIDYIDIMFQCVGHEMNSTISSIFGSISITIGKSSKMNFITEVKIEDFSKLTGIFNNYSEVLSVRLMVDINMIFTIR